MSAHLTVEPYDHGPTRGKGFAVLGVWPEVYIDSRSDLVEVGDARLTRDEFRAWLAASAAALEQATS